MACMQGQAISISSFNSSQVVWKPEIVSLPIWTSGFNSSQVVWKQPFHPPTSFRTSRFQFLIGSLEAFPSLRKPYPHIRFNSSQVVWKPLRERLSFRSSLVSIPHRQSGSNAKNPKASSESKFQFLIGSLEARVTVRGELLGCSFQFLIGSLEARFSRSGLHPFLFAQFQFLIGSLEALPGGAFSSLMCVSIPHRLSGSQL